MATPASAPASAQQRWALLRQLQHMLEFPMVLLGFAWLALLVVELTLGLAPAWERVGTVIWITFVAHFTLELFLAPERKTYLRRNWLAVFSLLLPALRIFRLARVIRLLRLTRAVRAVRFARVLTGVNRGLHSLRATMRRRGLGYVLGVTLLVALAGAAGMYAFEREQGQQAGFDSYASALWWTLMLLSTMGSEYWPRTGSGRALCLLLSVYGLAVFGYITAALASYFIGRDAEVRQPGRRA